MIKFSCKKCGQKLNVEDKHSGKRVKCPKCGSVRVVPDNSDKIKFDCKNCGHKISVPQIHAGKKGKCPKCKSPIVIPSLKKPSSERAGTFSIVCSMCDKTIQVPETSRGQTTECPECGSHIETSSGGARGKSDAATPRTTDEDPYQEETEEYEESEGVDRRIIVGISAAAAVVVAGLIILVAVLRSSGSRPAERSEDLRAQQQVTDTDSRPQPVTSDSQPEEPVEAIPLPKPPDDSPATQSAVIREDKKLAAMLTKGSIVSIHASGQTVGSVLTQIEKATGNQVRIVDEFRRDDEQTLSKRISINLQEKPFWEAIDAVSAAAGIKCHVIEDGTLRLSTEEPRFNKIEVVGASTVVGAFQMYPGFDDFFDHAMIVIRPEPQVGKPQLRSYQAEITLPGGEQIQYKPDFMFSTSSGRTAELTLRIDPDDLDLPKGTKKAQEIKIEARLAVASDFKAFTLPPLGELVPKPATVGDGVIYVTKAQLDNRSPDRPMFAVNLLAEGLTFDLKDIVLVDGAGNRLKSFGSGGTKQENRQNVSLNFTRAKISGDPGKCQLVFDVPGTGERTIGPLGDVVPKSTSTGASVIRITGANMTEQSNVGEDDDFEVRVEFDGFPGSRDGVTLVGTAGRPLVSTGWGGGGNMWQFWFDAAQIRGQPESYRLRFQAPTKVTEHVLRATFDNVPLMKEK
jgi:DNA-directed RNA polymerase subunit RPC12/RpoP